MHPAITTALLLPLGWGAYNIYCLFQNYKIARRTGLPIVLLVSSPDNPFWVLTQGFVLAIVRKIYGECSFTRFGRLGWEYYVKCKAHLELGDAIVLVTPGHNWFYICDAEAFNEIFQRRNGFPRPPEMLAMLDVFGPNISSASGADWQRQRKVTGTQFNEQNSGTVWAEALKQSNEVLEFWKSLPTPIRRTHKDTRTLSLHVLSGAGFGKSYSFKKAADPPKPGHMFNYRDSLALILENALLILVFGPKFLTRKWLPKRLSRLGRATLDFKDHMQQMVKDEKELIQQGKPGSRNIINSLIMASDEMSELTGDKGGSGRGLTEDEVYGNIFVYNFAGHDTMAITMNWTLYLLAAHPNVQDWIAEEINSVVVGDDAGKWKYQESYTKLNRCLAVLLETLRLWDPLIGIAKSTSSNPQPLTLNGETVTIPANSRVIPNINAMHSHPKYWGEDGLEWKPSRWILTEGSSYGENSKSKLKSRPDEEHLFSPQKGTYVPWSEGARACPGKKFGQVEFVATMVSLFRKHRIEVVPEKGESVEEARRRAEKSVWDSEIVLLLQMKKPELVGVKWVEAE
ncbi:hypothetical protein BGAL_0026g00110 [Botrytis galanthina]|uniref:Cytochrome P450 monooxygenase n=1 Tax=Botrytis galanthina TaxID=278940 RepID=A0A4S8R9T6_9HELO|nr:hypothetical protein BGAL_0026g00110 [Botrytis galanthina]